MGTGGQDEEERCSKWTRSVGKEVRMGRGVKERMKCRRMMKRRREPRRSERNKWKKIDSRWKRTGEEWQK